MTEHFLISDLAASFGAFFIGALFIFVPGYVLGWCLDVFGFRTRAPLAPLPLSPRLAIAVPLAVSTTPILSYLAWHCSAAAVWSMYAACWAGFLAIPFRERRLWVSRSGFFRKSAAGGAIA